MNGTSINMNFPIEILKFLSGKNGVSMIIKGPPGSGKTTLALQILEQLQSKYNIVYLSTRVGDNSLYNQFPWLKDMEKNLKLLINSRILLQEMSKNIVLSEKPVKEYGKRVVEELSGTLPRRVPRFMLNDLFQGISTPEIDNFYDEIELNLPNRSLAVIDSLEGITSRYGVGEGKFVNMINKDVVEGTKTSVIFVSEKDRLAQEDYVVDGVIYLDNSIENGKRIRKLSIYKLRGIESWQSSFVFSLSTGRIRTFYPQDYDLNVNDFKFVKNLGGLYSTGIPDLDNYFNGGMYPGSLITLSIGHNISNDQVFLIIRPFLLNFLMNSIGIFMIPLGGWSYSKLEADLSRFIPERLLKNRIKYVDYMSSESKSSNIIPANRDANSVNQLLIKAIIELSGLENKPVLQVIGTDMLEYIEGNETAIKDLFKTVQSLRASNDIGIFIVRECQKLKDEITNISDYYLILKDIENAPIIYGIKPKTIYNAITIDESKGFPNIKLIPIT